MEDIICIIADGYPYGESNHCVFVRELVVELAKLGERCIVIAPQMKNHNKKMDLPYHWVDKSDNITVDIFAPEYYSFSSKPGLMQITMRNHVEAVEKVLRKEKITPTIFYGHFIYLNGLTAAILAKRFNSKSVIACGENSNRLHRNSKPYATGMKYHNWKKILEDVNGIICVSTENERLLIENGFISNKKRTCVIPNGANTSVFNRMDRTSARKKLSIGNDDFVVAFVGAFIERKGNERVDAAVTGLDHVKTIFIGKGDFTPKSNCVFCGTVKHDELPKYLSAADVFVLPTTGEGCCNAIVEAICCGLPVISSKGSFNDDLLDENMSIRVDPENIGEIRSAIQILYNDKALCEKMGGIAIQKSLYFSLDARAKKVREFLRYCCSNPNNT